MDNIRILKTKCPGSESNCKKQARWEYGNVDGKVSD